MHTKEWVKSSCATLLVAAMMMQPGTALAQDPKDDQSFDQKKVVEIAPKSSDAVQRHTMRVEDAPYLSHEEKLELLRKKIKYVFVLFQENRSFDFYFGTYPVPEVCSLSPKGKPPDSSNRSSRPTAQLAPSLHS
jgi:phospholipase C